MFNAHMHLSTQTQSHTCEHTSERPLCASCCRTHQTSHSLQAGPLADAWRLLALPPTEPQHAAAASTADPGGLTPTYVGAACAHI